MTKEYSFSADKSGIRLDKFAGDRCPELSRTYAQKLIAGGYITVNGLGAKANLKLEPGDKVNITVPPPPSSPLSPEPMSLSIVYEDADLLVVDKPPGDITGRRLAE